MKFNHCLSVVAVAALSTSIVGCGSSSSSNGVDLGSLPSASQLVATNGSSSSFSRAAVSGTPDIVTDLAIADFYGDLGDRVTAGNPTLACALEVQEFFGSSDGGIGGDTACWMSQTVAGAVSNLMSNSGSVCYMKNIPNATSGVTITPAGTDPDTVFAQTSEDKVVKVLVSDPEGDQTVFIKVHGSSNPEVGATKYKAELWFCNPDDSISGHETFIVDTNANTFTATGVNDDGEGANTFNMSAKILIGTDGSVTFDATQERSATVQWVGTSGDKFKSEIVISGDNIVTAKDKSEGTWGSNDNIVKAEISGSGISSLRFLQGAIRGYSTHQEGDPHTFSGAVEWQTSLYRAVASSDLLTALDADYRTEDSFYDSAASITPDFSGLSCDTTASIEITMDFESEGVAAIQEICEGDRFEWTDICNGNDVNDIRNIIYNSFDPDADDNTCG
jgi:hypothetical protein